MLFYNEGKAGQTNEAPPQANIRMAGDGEIVLGGGFQLVARTVDNGTIRLGGGFRLPVREA